MPKTNKLPKNDVKPANQSTTYQTEKVFCEIYASDGQWTDCGWYVGVPSETRLLWPEFKVIIREQLFLKVVCINKQCF